MTKIREYDLATGHVETLATVPESEAAATLERLDDHSTDHVIYSENDDEEDKDVGTQA